MYMSVKETTQLSIGTITHCMCIKYAWIKLYVYSFIHAYFINMNPFIYREARYSSEAERDNQEIYDDFKWEKPFGLHTRIFQRSKG